MKATSFPEGKSMKAKSPRRPSEGKSMNRASQKCYEAVQVHERMILYFCMKRIARAFCRATCDYECMYDDCDVVVGISDGRNVWAVGRGETGLDTLPPFPLGSSVRCPPHLHSHPEPEVTSLVQSISFLCTRHTTPRAHHNYHCDSTVRNPK